MKKYLAILLLLVPSLAFAAPPAISLPPEVPGAIGDFIKVPATTAGKDVRWVAMDAGLNLFPVELLKDSKTAVVIAQRAGRYRLLAYTALGDEPSDPAISTVVVGGVGPGPGPGPPPPVDPPPVEKVSAVTFVYEKDLHVIPPPVMAALNALNRGERLVNGERKGGFSKLLATSIEQDTKNGLGEVPAQYKTAIDAARAAGLPSLVVIGNGGQKVLKVVKNPKTEDDVLKAVP